MEIQGCGAVVSGGGSGLGEATARALAARGAHVAILDLAKSKGAEVAKAIGGKSFFAETDVANEAQVTEAIDRAVSSFGAVHVAVNCAGIGVAGRTIDKEGKPFDLGWFTRCIQVNLVGTFNVIRIAASRMSKHAPNPGGERGVIVNTASIAAFDGQIGQAAYSASKGGVVGMTLPIARDLSAVGIRVCTIAPGTFDTPMLAGAPEHLRQALAANIPFPRRLGDPAEFAALACHIVENPMLNGETIRIDGALRMAPK
ncbi:MAG TPA: SDR family NAD(P)-dependent oxidoreductase [Myxococcota bacterium]|jgi:NAD(P)-dependent dehydrogenase (short-subunit alcohol dehydrogenase family)|nr:SDR family NAD(P)-dependent oxidoreductase [Myxococcota bacterium]